VDENYALQKWIAETLCDFLDKKYIFLATNFSIFSSKQNFIGYSYFKFLQTEIL
jgi:hypothetical protein